MRPGILSASLLASAVLGLVAPTHQPPKANARLASELLKVTVPGWSSAKSDPASESADLVKEMKATYTGTIAATGRTWVSTSSPSQFVNISLVAYLHAPRTIQRDLRKLVPKDAWVLCRGLSAGATPISTATLPSAGNGIIERCQDGHAGAVFAKANVLAFVGINDPADPTAINRIAAAQYRALSQALFEG